MVRTAFLRTTIGEHHRIAYTKICTDEWPATGWARPDDGCFADHGVEAERVLTVNG